MVFRFISQCYSDFNFASKNIWLLVNDVNYSNINQYYISNDHKKILSHDPNLQSMLLYAFKPPIYSNYLEKLVGNPILLLEQDIRSGFIIIENVKYVFNIT